MKIVATNIDIVRATPAVAEFIVRVELDEPPVGCSVAGRAVGPRCERYSTVEVEYPLKPIGASGASMSLRCAIPEPNLWSPESPFTYAVTIEVLEGKAVVDSRVVVLALRNRTD